MKKEASNRKNDIIFAPCKHCVYCRQKGRQNSQRGQLGRKRYYCEHPRVHDMKEKNGLPLYPFIGYGDMSVKSPLVLKTHKAWCPLRQKEG